MLFPKPFILKSHLQ
jgi:hypothetical protein